MTDDALNDMFAQMVEADSDDIDLRVTRDPEPGKTFSKNALDEIRLAMETFIMARISRRFRDRGADKPGVSDMTVSLRLTLDGESRTTSLAERPWYIVDGKARQKAVTERYVAAAQSDAANRRTIDNVVASLSKLPDDNLRAVVDAVRAELQRRADGYGNAAAAMRDM